MRPAALTAVVVAVALSATLAPSAHAVTTRSLCAPTAVLLDSPEGFAIAHLRRPERLEVRRRSANRRWALVVTRNGTVGWLPVKRLCRA
jgi:hypothetical protein